MASKWIEVLTGSLEEKKQYREAVARLDALPEPHREAARAVHRYLLRYGGLIDGEHVAQMAVDLADLWEGSVASGATVHQIVGDEPVEFAETLALAYGGKGWIDAERARLRSAIAAATEGSSS